MIFVGSTGGRWIASSTPTDAPVGGDQLVAVPDGLDRCTLEEDAAVLGHAAAPLRVHPVSGRSNHTCTWLVPMEFS